MFTVNQFVYQARSTARQAAAVKNTPAGRAENATPMSSDPMAKRPLRRDQERTAPPKWS
jgi:hypothetical protein